jgi:spectinomycin phosphotransferase
VLEKPSIQDTQITACLRDAYGLNIVGIEFLPLGADRNTAVYRAAADNSGTYFVKLRGGEFDELTTLVPKLLHEQGIRHVIAPMASQTQQLWVELDNFKLSVFPFIEGRDGYEMALQDHHWVEFGRALKAIHTAKLSPAVTDRIQRERYSANWREAVSGFQVLIEKTTFADPIAAELVAFLKRKGDTINRLVGRAKALAPLFQSDPRPFIMCHADIHAGNILIGGDDHLYIVDWDTLTLASKERDLMFVGGGLFGGRRSPQEEEMLFYQGYGATEIDGSTLIYYRFERIVQDIAAYCEQILLTEGESQDRKNGLRQLTRQFQPGGVVGVAFETEKRLALQYKSE